MKLAFSLRDGHVAYGERSHAELIGPFRRYDDYVRAVVFPEYKAVYFRLYAPRYDGMGRPTEEELAVSYEAAGKAFAAFVRHGLIEKAYRPLYWDTGRLPLNVRL